MIDVGLYKIGLVAEPFTYAGDISTYPIGSLVKVSVQEQTHRAVVLGETSKQVSYAVKDIEGSLENPYAPLLTPIQIAVAKKMATYYLSPFHRVMKSFIPEKIFTGSFEPKREISYVLSDTVPEISPRAKKVQAVVALLRDRQPCKKDELGVTDSMLRSCIQKGIVDIRYGELLPVLSNDKLQHQAPTLTKEQQHIVDNLLHEPQKALIHAVTGAGKTEMYMKLAEHVIKQGRQVLIVVPEIALTPQLVRYVQRLVGDRVSVFHSHLAEGEKLQEWVRVRTGHSQLILGSRSSIFAPFQQLGAIIVDEEHEWTYKNEQHPRYHTKRVAEWFYEESNRRNVPMWVVLGSATPSIETMHDAKKHHYRLYTLDKKIYQQTPLSNHKNLDSLGMS